MTKKAESERITIYVAVPPRALLLNIAGPLEVLRVANLEHAQERSQVRFDVRYIGSAESVATYIGVTLSRISPFTGPLPADAMVMLTANVERIMVALSDRTPADHKPKGISDPAVVGDQSAIVEWLRTAIEPSHTLLSICSGALLAGRALLDGYACTTHPLDCSLLAALAPGQRSSRNASMLRRSPLHQRGSHGRRRPQIGERAGFGSTRQLQRACRKQHKPLQQQPGSPRLTRAGPRLPDPA